MQLSGASNTSWRVNLLLDNDLKTLAYGSSGNNVAQQRVFSVLEYGGIQPFTEITFQIQAVNGLLPESLQNNDSYCVVEYDL